VTEILHVAFRDAWADAVAGAAYLASGRGMTVAAEGFVHCATRAQLGDVLTRHYEGVPREELLVLVIDADAVAADGVDVRFENTSGGTELFPHIYGELRPAWVGATEPTPAS